MQISGSRIDDFKTDRKGIMPPLPMVFRLVPILFYGAVAFLLVIGSVATFQLRHIEGRAAQIQAETSQLQASIEMTKQSRAALGADIRRATDLEAWVLASMPLQSLVVAIIRSMGPRAAIIDLTVERDPETPSQLRLRLRLSADSDKQLEVTLDTIRQMNYREFSPTQTMVRGDLDYRTKLLWDNPAETLPSPEERGQ
jgi:hypothetical protein